MPCDDVTESLRIVISEQDRLESYELIKRSCGRAVGERSLMEDAFQGKTVDELLDIDTDTFAEAHPTGDEVEMFLQLKHLFAVQAGLQALTGVNPAGPSEPVRVASVACEDSRVIIEAEISLDVITEKIEACGKCKGCGSIAAKLAKA